MMYRFGDYTLDTQRYELRHASTLCPIEPQVFDILRYLLMHRDRVVTRQELLEHVWPDRFISEATLDHRLMQARQAIGDSGQSQRCIKTLRGRGYRFVATVEERTPTASHGTEQVTAPPSDAPRIPHQGSTPPASPTRPPLSTALVLPDMPLPVGTVPAGERKQVTVLCCDIANATVLAEQHGHEAIYPLLHGFFESALDEVQQYAGTVVHFRDDGFMALFGAPIAYEDHAQRAVRTALGIQQRLQQGNLGVPDAALAVRLGLHTGWVIAGAVRTDGQRHYTAVGDTISLGMRQQQTIAPGTIQLTAPTYTLVAGYFQCVAVASPDVPEATTPAQVYRVLGERGVRSRFEVSHMRGLTPFVGRERELTVLHERLAQAATGQGQVVGIVGEPGIGKSRLLYEFRHRYHSEPVTYRDAHCLSYGNTTPYLPVRDLLRQVCTITDTDPPERITTRLHQCLHEAGMDPATWLPYLQQLLGYRTGTEPLALLSPEAIKRQTFTVLRQMQLQTSRQRPLILVVEDLQWIDTISEDFFASLVDSLAHAAVLFVATYRPGYQPPWMGKSYAMQLTLPPLAPRDSQSLVQSLCQGSPVSETLLQPLLTGAEGNPLFLEEMIRAALEHGETPTSLIIPATIQDMLMARLDRLPDGPRRLLQTASVLGRDVPRRLLEGLWEGPGDLDTLLLVLSRQELLDEHPGAADLVYRFRHALMQDVAYSSMVVARRQALHAAAGCTLEALHADHLDTVIERLAYHYAHSAEADKAITYLRQLATRAARSYAHIEALAVLAEARRHATRLPEGIRERHLLDLSVLQAFSLSILGRFRDILDLLLPQQELADRLGEPLLAGPYYFRLGMTYFYVGDTAAAIQNAQRAIAAAQQGHDATTLGQAYYLLAMERYVTGQDLARGIAYARQAVTVLDSPEAWHWRGLAHFMVGVTAVYLGDFPLAMEATGQVQAIGDASGDPRLQSFAAVIAGWVATIRGEWEAGITTCQRSLALSPDPFSAAVATGFLGYAYLESGDAAQATPLLEQAVAQCEQMRYRLGQGRFANMLSAALLMQGRLDAACALAQQSLMLFGAVKHRYGIGLAQRTLGRIAQARGALAEAEQTYTEALTIFAAMSARYELGRTYLDFASLTAAQGNQTATSAHLTAAHALFKSMQLPHYVQRIATMLQS